MDVSAAHEAKGLVRDHRRTAAGVRPATTFPSCCQCRAAQNVLIEYGQCVYSTPWALPHTADKGGSPRRREITTVWILAGLDFE
jgi:hypothetical protein